MGLTFKHFYDPLSWRTCPSCKGNLVDAEISEVIKPFSLPYTFHSLLLGEKDRETGRLEFWKCPHCEATFQSEEGVPVIHTMSDKLLKKG